MKYKKITLAKQAVLAYLTAALALFLVLAMRYSEPPQKPDLPVKGLAPSAQVLASFPKGAQLDTEATAPFLVVRDGSSVCALKAVFLPKEIVVWPQPPTYHPF